MSNLYSRYYVLGIRLIAIGIGNDVDINELNLIASSTDDVIRVDDFNRLNDQLEPIIRTACQNYTFLPPGVHENSVTKTQ